MSAFGLGNDFDEELMKNVAEHGSGAYFFIEGSSAIPKFVDFALKGLFKLVGTDAILRIRGLNGAVVTKIYSHGDLTKVRHITFVLVIADKSDSPFSVRSALQVR